MPKSRIYETKNSFVYLGSFLFLRKGSGALENYEKAEQDYIAGMKYKDIRRNTGQLLTRSRAGRKDMRGVEKRVHTKLKRCAHKNKRVHL